MTDKRIKRTKTNPYDWALIQWSRACEESNLVDFRRVEPTLDAEKDDFGRLVDPIAYLAARAGKVLDSLKLSGKRWMERSRNVWIASAVFVILLGALVFPFARADRLLGDDVNLAGPFVFFILGQLFFLAWALILIGAVCFQSIKRRLFGKERPLTFAEKLVASLSGIVGTVVLFCVHHAAPVFYAMFARKGTERFAWRRRRDAQQEAKRLPGVEGSLKRRTKSPTQKGVALFWDTLFSRPRFLFFWGGFLSHLFWTSCSLCVLILLVARMQGNQYDYCWRTSLEDQAAVKKGVDLLGAPILWLGGSIPSEEDVACLFDEQGVGGAKDKSAKEKSEAERLDEARAAAKTRAKWSYFLLGIVFVWCVTPRFILVCIYYFMFRRALRDYRPNLKDPYFEGLILEAEAYSTTTESSFVDDPVETSVLALPGVDNLDAQETSKAESPPVAESEPSVSEYAEGARREGEAVALTLGAASEGLSVAAKLEPSSETLSVMPESELASLSEPAPTLEPTTEALSVAAVLEPVVEETPIVAAEPEPEPPKPVILAFGYDAELTAEQWRALLPADPELRLFGDVAGDFERRKKLKEYLAESGELVALCVYVTDVGLSPAKHYTKFMRDVLTPAIPNAIVYVVLTGSEKLRLKFGVQTNAVAERIEDWTNTLNSLSRTSGLTIYPVFSYDADLDLPEPRARLRDLLRVGGDPNDAASVPSRDYSKWDETTRRVLAECRIIFAAEGFESDEEEERRRVAQVCADIFETYREETEQATQLGVKDVTQRLGDDSLFEKFKVAASSSTGAVLGAVAQSTSVKEALVERCKEHGLDSDFIEQRLTSALGLSEKMRVFCSKLSPKCAIATASVGLSIPALVAFAPLLGGAATATAVASAFGALGTLLPASVASGVTAGALGAVAPMSFSACKKKLVGKLSGVFRHGSSAKDSASKEPVAEALSAESLAKIETASALVCVTTTWRVVLELQGRPEDEITSLTPEILAPIEESSLDSIEVITKSLSDVRALLPNESFS